MEVAGETSFLGVSVKVSPGEISICRGRLRKQSALPVLVGTVQSPEGQNRTKERMEDLLSLSWNMHLLCSDSEVPGS